MPSFVGLINITAVANSGVFNVGDVYKIAPISASRTFAGAGSFNTGNGLTVTNQYSTTNTYDSDGVDQPVSFTL